MYTLEQLEKVKKHYEKILQETRLKLQESIDEKEFAVIGHDIRLSIYKPSEMRIENSGYSKYLARLDSYIDMDTRMVERNERELDALNKMIDELKQGL